MMPATSPPTLEITSQALTLQPPERRASAMSSREQIKTALELASEAVRLKPAFGQRVYVNTAVVESGLACNITEKRHVMAADLPASMGGDDSGPSPSVLMRAALSSCVAVGVKMWAARKDVAIDRVEVVVETDVDARGQFGIDETVSPGFEAVRIHIRADSPADAELVHE